MVNFITKFLLVVGKNTILVVYNRLLKIVHFVVIKELIQLFRDNIWKLNRLLESVILDQRLQFAAELTKKLSNILEIQIIFINKQADRINELETRTVSMVLYRLYVRGLA